MRSMSDCQFLSLSRHDFKRVTITKMWPYQESRKDLKIKTMFTLYASIYLFAYIINFRYLKFNASCVWTLGLSILALLCRYSFFFRYVIDELFFLHKNRILIIFQAMNFKLFNTLYLNHFQLYIYSCLLNILSTLISTILNCIHNLILFH